MKNEKVCRECNENFDEPEQVRRHVRYHKMTYQEYLLKWKYNNALPLCKCGCGKETSWNIALKDFAGHVQGHHAWGRKKSEEEKQKIGRKNSINMKRYMKENPNVAKTRCKQMRVNWTSENECKRIAATKQAYANMSKEDKKKFSDNAKNLWNNNRELMNKAHRAATKTWKERANNGEYDFESRNQKISKTVTQKYIDGGFKWSRGKYMSSKTNQTIYYRSSWERDFAILLDNDSDVKTWKYEWESIKYMFNGKTHRYIPDFLVEMQDGKHRFVEVKPKELVNTEMNIAKRTAALNRCKERGWHYETWPM